MTTINAIGTQDPTEIAKGGTGQGTATAAFDALSPVTTQGDIIYRDASNNVRLAKGTANQLLAMNSGATAPEWQDAPSSDSITVTAAPTSDTTASGVKIQLTANEAQNFGDAVYLLATGKAGIADASAIATSRVFAICTSSSVAGDATGEYTITGISRNDAWAWTVGAPIYLTITGTTQNSLSETAPSASGECVVIIGTATHADRILVNPNSAIIEIS